MMRATTLEEEVYEDSAYLKNLKERGTAAMNVTRGIVRDMQEEAASLRPRATVRRPWPSRRGV